MLFGAKLHTIKLINLCLQLIIVKLMTTKIDRGNYWQQEYDGTKKQSCVWFVPCTGPSLVEVKEW